MGTSESKCVETDLEARLISGARVHLRDKETADSLGFGFLGVDHQSVSFNPSDPDDNWHRVARCAGKHSADLNRMSFIELLKDNYSAWRDLDVLLWRHVFQIPEITQDIELLSSWSATWSRDVWKVAVAAWAFSHHKEELRGLFVCMEKFQDQINWGTMAAYANDTAGTSWIESHLDRVHRDHGWPSLCRNSTMPRNVVHKYLQRYHQELDDTDLQLWCTRRSTEDEKFRHLCGWYSKELIIRLVGMGQDDATVRGSHLSLLPDLASMVAEYALPELPPKIVEDSDEDWV